MQPALSGSNGNGILVTNYGKIVHRPRNDRSSALPFSSKALNKIWLKVNVEKECIPLTIKSGGFGEKGYNPPYEEAR